MVAILRLYPIGDSLTEVEIAGTFPYPITTKFQFEVAKFIVMVLVLSIAEQAEKFGGWAIQKQELNPAIKDEELIIYTSYKFKNQSKLEKFKKSIDKKFNE